MRTPHTRGLPIGRCAPSGHWFLDTVRNKLCLVVVVCRAAPLRLPKSWPPQGSDASDLDERNLTPRADYKLYIYMRLQRTLPFVVAALILLMCLLMSRQRPSSQSHNASPSLSLRILKLEEQVREVSAILAAADNDSRSHEPLPLPPPRSSPPPPPPSPPSASSSSSRPGSGSSETSCSHETAAARAARRYLLQPERLHASLPGAPHEPLHLTFATSSVEELLTNWVAHVRRLHLPAVVAAMDQPVLQSCLRLRTHCLPMLSEEWDAALATEAERTGQHNAGQVNIRGNALLFLSLGARKVASILILLDAGSGAVLCLDCAPTHGGIFAVSLPCCYHQLFLTLLQMYHLQAAQFSSPTSTSSGSPILQRWCWGGCEGTRTLLMLTCWHRRTA